MLTQECLYRQLRVGKQESKINAMILFKSNVLPMKGNQLFYFRLKLKDKEQSEFWGTFFDQSQEVCQNRNDSLRVGSVYTFYNFQVAFDKFPHQSVAICLIFQNQTGIAENMDHNQYQVGEIVSTTIQEVKQFEHDQTCDMLLAIVKQCGPLSSVKPKNGIPISKRTYQIIDQTGLIEFTLWEDKAEQFNYQIGQIIAIQQVRVVSIQEVKFLQGTIFTHVETLEHQLSCIQGYKELSQWFNNNKDNLKFTQQNQNLIQNQQKSIKEIKSQAKKCIGDINCKYFNEVRCVNADMNSQNIYLYPSCGKCNKKCEQISFEFHCSQCSDKVHQPIWKFILTIKLRDESGSLQAIFFDLCASQLLNVDAEKYYQFSDEQRQEIQAKCLNQDNRYRLKTQFEMQQGVLTTKHYVVEILGNFGHKETIQNTYQLQQM